MDRRLVPASLGLVSAVVGAALFVYGLLRVEDPMSLSGLVLAVGGALVAAASAVRARRPVAAGVVAVVDVLVLGFVAWTIWRLLHVAT
jgi:uncharacterized membrane protein